jgi:dTDP-4-amino-4,6-dideoxygalactose transaminase
VKQGVAQPVVPEGCAPAWHLYHLVFPDEAFRNRVIDALESNGVHAVFHYVPLHTAPGARAVGVVERSLPHTESRSARLVRLPFFNALAPEQQDDIIQTVQTVVA